MTYLKGHDDFVSRYMRFCDIDNSEAPAVYHRWVCLSILSAAIGRNAYIEQGQFRIYLNQYKLVIGAQRNRNGCVRASGRKRLKASGYERY